MSKYEARVLNFTKENIIKHDNADSLSIYLVNNSGYQVCIRSSDWLNEDGSPKYNKCVFIEPQTIVNSDLPQFTFLKVKDTDTKVRVKARKLRGAQSFGVLIPVDDIFKEDTDLWAEWGLEHYEPQPESESGNNGQNVNRPQRDFPKYDLQNIKNYLSAFISGEPILAMEKTEGQNMRVCFQNEQIYVGSRNLWKADVEGSCFWRSFRSVPNLEKFLKENPHLSIFGESYGNVPKFLYDCNKGDRKFRAFDIFDTSVDCWLQYPDFLKLCSVYDIPFCPIIYEGPFDFEKLKELAELDSPLRAGQMMEGLVVWPQNCDYHVRLGRRKAKLKSLRYEEKS